MFTLQHRIAHQMGTSKPQNNGRWYAGRWWVGCYISYSEDGPAQSPPRCTKCKQLTRQRPVYQLHIIRIRCGTIITFALEGVNLPHLGKMLVFGRLRLLRCLLTLQHYETRIKLVCRRKAARCFVSLNISLSHLMSLEVIRFDITE